MFYQSELSFLIEIFRKSRVGVQIIEVDELKPRLEGAAKKLDLDIPAGIDRLPRLESTVVYRLSDALGRHFRLLLLPDYSPTAVLIAGPFLTAAVSSEQALELGERLGIAPHDQQVFSELYLSVPVLADDSPIFSVFDTFCERIWGTDKYRHHDLSDTRASDAPVSLTMQGSDRSDTQLTIKAMEQRYAFENQLIRAVSLGQTRFEAKLDAAFTSNLFENRVPDPIRNTKNYMIIMNTLLRKAAEQGGVHPIHIDRASSDFARRIEAISSLPEIRPLMTEMFRSYCRLVRNHSLGELSPIVQKTILLIDADLSADLSPNVLAQGQSVSLGYLSTVFKKETGQTLSEYVRRRRMEYAAYLLTTTSLQIQTVALHCGIMDVQYFSKIFKSHFKKTPTDYRHSGRSSEQNRQIRKSP